MALDFMNDLTECFTPCHPNSYIPEIGNTIPTADVRNFFAGMIHPAERGICADDFIEPLKRMSFPAENLNAYQWILESGVTAIGGSEWRRFLCLRDSYVSLFYLYCHASIAPGPIELASLSAAIFTRSVANSDTKRLVLAIRILLWASQAVPDPESRAENPIPSYHYAIEIIFSNIYINLFPQQGVEFKRNAASSLISRVPSDSIAIQTRAVWLHSIHLIFGDL